MVFVSIKTFPAVEWVGMGQFLDQMETKLTSDSLAWALAELGKSGKSPKRGGDQRQKSKSPQFEMWTF